MIIGIKGYLQKTNLFFLGILSHAEIPVNEKMAISTDKQYNTIQYIYILFYDIQALGLHTGSSHAGEQ